MCRSLSVFLFETQLMALGQLQYEQTSFWFSASCLQFIPDSFLQEIHSRFGLYSNCHSDCANKGLSVRAELGRLCPSSLCRSTSSWRLAFCLLVFKCNTSAGYGKNKGVNRKLKAPSLVPSAACLCKLPVLCAICLCFHSSECQGNLQLPLQNYYACSL